MNKSFHLTVEVLSPAVIKVLIKDTETSKKISYVEQNQTQFIL